MSKKYTTDNITISEALNDGSGVGTSGQVLSSTGSGVSWIDGSGIVGGPYLALSGGTMTGALTGTTANFTGGILTLGQNKIDGSSDNLKISADFGSVSGSSTIEFLIDGSEKLNINNGGKVTFSTNGGTITTIGSDIAITQGAVGLRINDAASAISPTTATSNNDNVVDLGVSNIRFRNLYMGGSITSGGGATFAGNVTFGDSHFIGDDASDNLLIQSSTGENIIIDSLDETLFRINGSTKMQIKSSGNVGIGNTNPTSGLSVTKSMGAAWLVDFVNTNVSGHGLLIQAGGTTGTRYITQWKDALGTERFHMEDNGEVYFQGNVGIGTTSPAQKLDVNGNLAISGTTFVDSTRRNIYLNSFAGGGANGIFFRDGFTYNASITAEDHNGSSADGICISGYDGVSFSTGANTKNERMRITSAGNVGIGTTAPGYPFSLENSGTALISRIYNTNADGQGLLIRAGATNSSTRAFQVASSNDTKIMTVNSNGNVGIGTTTPENLLHVQQAGLFTGIHTTAGIRVKSSGASAIDNYHGTIALSRGTGSVAISAVQEATDSDVMGMAFFTHPSTTGADAAVEQMRIDQNGNVGIGTTSPTGKLTVYTSANRFQSLKGANADLEIVSDNNTNPVALIKGTGTADLLNVFDNTTEVFTIRDGGNVGIKNTNPSYLLDIGAANVENPVDYIRLNPTNGNGDGTSNTLGGGLIWAPNYATYTKKSAGIIAVGEGNYFRTGLAFLTNNSANQTGNYAERMRITSGGELRVGHNSGTYTNTQTFASFGNTVVADEYGVQLSSKGNGLAGMFGSNTHWANGTFSKPTSGRSSGYLEISNSGSNNTGSSFNFYTVPQGSTTHTSRMTIDSAGNVGIGDSSPSYKLDVNGTGRFTGVLYANTYVNTPAVYGTTVSVGGAAGGSPRLNFSATGITTQGTGDISLLSGNIGINTTAPLAKLDVRGTLRSDQDSSGPNGTSGVGELDTLIGDAGPDNTALGTPDQWLRINISGSDYVIPAYTAP